MTTDQRSLLTRQDLLSEYHATVPQLERALDAVSRWAHATTDPEGWTLEDWLREVRLHATTLRTLSGLLQVTRI